MSAALTYRRAALAVAAVALLVYLPALRNGYALDDSPIIERNPAAQSVGAALRAFDDPYWPPEHEAGLWRPIVILSFAADYQLSGGSTTWLHATNTVLHALVSGLVVVALAPYATASAALAGGLLFAVHPVHVEAVANLVGRAELLAALFLLLAIWCGRAIRERSAAGGATVAHEMLLLLLVALALLCKEHAVIALPLLLLDQEALGRGRLRPRMLVLLAVLTGIWLVVRSRAEGGAGFATLAPTFFGLGAAGRLATMMPVVLVIARLLIWPFDLSADYHPRVIERLTGLTPAGVAGLVVLIAAVALAVLCWRRRRTVSVGLLIIGLAWAPTSNLLLPTGIVLAERTLYLSSIGLVMVAAGLFDLAAAHRRAAMVVIAVVTTLWAARSLTRIPDWRSTRDLVVAGLLTHPESYKVHQSAARVMVRLGDRAAAQREYRTAMALYDRDYFMVTEAGANAIEIGELAEALRLLRHSEQLNPRRAMTHYTLARLLLLTDSGTTALAHARRAVELDRRAAEASRMLVSSYLRLGFADSARAVWPAFAAAGGARFDYWLLSATTFAATGLPDSAGLALDSAAAAVPADSVSVRRLAQARQYIAGPR